MNIVYASDNNFADILGISMISLFENNCSCENITVYILDGGISEENRLLLSEVAKKYDRSLYFLLSSDHLDNEMKQQRGSLSTFSRLYMEKLLPADVNKILYLDCDLLVLQNIEDFYNNDLSEKLCEGISDCVSDSHLNLIGLKSGDNYFNAGVLLINLEMWRKWGAAEKFISFSEKFNNNVPYADQGIINGVLSTSSKNADLRYNCYTALFDFDYNDLMTFRKPSVFYSQNEFEAARKNPAVVHFTTSFLSLRPWVEGCKHPYASEWLKYKKMSPWANTPLRKDNRSAAKKFAVKIYNLLPDKIAVGIAGYLHSKVIPTLKGIFK